MTNEEAIIHFKEQLKIFGGEHHEAMRVAIEALENQNDCKDCAGCTQWLCDCANVRAVACDRIVEQLEGLPNVNSDYWNSSDLIDREDAIEIVKGVRNE